MSSDNRLVDGIIQQFIEIKVSKENIKSGIRRTGNLCPISMALIDHGFYCPSVSEREISFVDSNGLYWYSFYVAKKVRKFIFKFDSGYQVTPFRFLLDVEANTNKNKNLENFCEKYNQTRLLKV